MMLTTLVSLLVILIWRNSESLMWSLFMGASFSWLPQGSDEMKITVKQLTSNISRNYLCRREKALKLNIKAPSFLTITRSLSIFRSVWGAANKHRNLSVQLSPRPRNSPINFINWNLLCGRCLNYWTVWHTSKQHLKSESCVSLTPAKCPSSTVIELLRSH